MWHGPLRKLLGILLTLTGVLSLVFGSQKFHHFAIPIRRRSTYLHRLRVHGNDDPEVFGDSVKEEPADPEVVAHVDALVRPDLELPLQNQVTM